MRENVEENMEEKEEEEEDAVEDVGIALVEVANEEGGDVEKEDGGDVEKEDGRDEYSRMAGRGTDTGLCFTPDITTSIVSFPLRMSSHSANVCVSQKSSSSIIPVFVPIPISIAAPSPIPPSVPASA